MPALRAAASTGNSARVDELAEVFVRDVKKLLEVSKVARNLSASEPIAITAEKVEENIQTLCPHVRCLDSFILQRLRCGYEHAAGL